MHELSKLSPNYRNLVVRGVVIKHLRCVDFHSDLWECECMRISALPRDKAKEYTRAFLQDEFEAMDCDFFQPKASPDGTQFRVTFRSWSM